MMPFARHSLIEFGGCDAEALGRSDLIRPVLIEAVRAGGGTIVAEMFHDFSPHGVTGVIVIAESHVAIHTWPEHRLAAVDIFSCSERLEQRVVQEVLYERLGATEVHAREVDRFESSLEHPEPMQ